MQDRCQTQLCGRNKLEYAHRQFSTFRERQKSSSHPFENASFIFQQKSDIVTPWGSSQLVNSGPFSPIFIADAWCLSLLANCSASWWERFLFISNSTSGPYHFYHKTQANACTAICLLPRFFMKWDNKANIMKCISFLPKALFHFHFISISLLFHSCFISI